MTSADRIRLVTADDDERSRDLGAVLPGAISVQDTHTPADMIDSLFLVPYLTGEQPHACTAHLDQARPDAPLMPAGAKVLRTSLETEGRDVWLASGDGWTIKSVRWQNGSADIAVIAVRPDLAKATLAVATDGAVVPKVADDGKVRVSFWHRANGVSQRYGRSVRAAAWSQIRGNYASAAAGALTQLTAMTPQTLSGRLILLHGAPGTGKTTLLRTLALQWRSWCKTDCVLDPEMLFSDPGYLLEVTIGPSCDCPEEHWRLLILEDCDELISGEARRASGQALSRLLNLTDGMLGQGRNVLIAITTNEDLSRLHPAVTRPGRCLAQIEVGPLSADEATAWLGQPVYHPVSLAELYALRDGGAPAIAVASEGPPTGQYL